MSAAFSCTVRSRLWTSIWMVFSVSLTVVRACATVLLLAAGARRQRRAAGVPPSDGQHAHFWARGCTTCPSCHNTRTPRPWSDVLRRVAFTGQRCFKKRRMLPLLMPASPNHPPGWSAAPATCPRPSFTLHEVRRIRPSTSVGMRIALMLVAGKQRTDLEDHGLRRRHFMRTYIRSPTASHGLTAPGRGAADPAGWPRRSAACWCWASCRSAGGARTSHRSRRPQSRRRSRSHKCSRRISPSTTSGSASRSATSLRECAPACRDTSSSPGSPRAPS